MASFEPARLNGVRLIQLKSVGYRHQAPGFDPRSGEGARRFGGRFNPPRSFLVVYLCLTKPCVVAELTHQAVRQGIQVEDLLPRELWSLATDLERVLDFTDAPVLTAAGLGPADLVRPSHAFTQQIGGAAHERGVQAIKSPSATGVGEILALLPENLGGATLQVELVEVRESSQDMYVRVHRAAHMVAAIVDFVQSPVSLPEG